jgi:hypothetical protein
VGGRRGMRGADWADWAVVGGGGGGEGVGECCAGVYRDGDIRPNAGAAGDLKAAGVASAYDETMVLLREFYSKHL